MINGRLLLPLPVHFPPDFPLLFSLRQCWRGAIFELKSK